MTSLSGPLQMPQKLTRRLLPEQRLLLAIIERAILDWWGFRRAISRGRRGYDTGYVSTDLKDLEEWIRDEGDHLWSFRWICAEAFKDEEFAVRKIRAILTGVVLH